MHDGSVYLLPLSALLTPGSASSSWPSVKTLFRTPLASDSLRGGETLDKVKARRGTIALSHQIIDLALHGPDGSLSRHSDSATLWSLTEDIFTAGDVDDARKLDGFTACKVNGCGQFSPGCCCWWCGCWGGCRCLGSGAGSWLL